mgnify:CR=1 FL=1
MQLIYLLPILFLIFYIFKSKILNPNYSIFFSCTTYLARPGKFKELKDALQSIHQYKTHNFKHFLIINEYDPKNKSPEIKNQIQYLMMQYPYINFINKSENNGGQARSLNIILEMAKKSGCKYWIQWEEGWYITGENKDIFIEAQQIMETSSLSQLQLTEDWRNLESWRQKKMSNGSIQILPFQPVKYFRWNKYRHLPEYRRQWPIFSLRPSINRISDFWQIGKFDESSEKWPVEFECDYGFRFLSLGLAKGILGKSPTGVKRNPMHKSTYTFS